MCTQFCMLNQNKNFVVFILLHTQRVRELHAWEAFLCCSIWVCMGSMWCLGGGATDTSSF